MLHLQSRLIQKTADPWLSLDPQVIYTSQKVARQVSNSGDVPEPIYKEPIVEESKLEQTLPVVENRYIPQNQTSMFGMENLRS